ncbi:cytochrome c biogenesis protein CcdA [Mesorhizobium sp.]|uniref:redoxin family protein n=1 Tax=Mesorhizobium sp. TaxID=1871066 RepID=UPI003BA8635C
MTVFALAYLAGMFTIATPCIFPILPFVLARANRPFSQGGLPMLLGLAFAFAAVASLASVAGGWAVEINKHGRTAALALIILFGVAMLMPAVAARITMPLVSIGSRLSRWSFRHGPDKDRTTASSLILGVATGFVWAPCAGPILGLILTGAALRGPSTETSLLLLTYGFGAATGLGIGVLCGKRLFAALRQSIPWAEGLRRISGAAVIAGALAISLGVDTGLLTRLASTSTTTFEQWIITTLSEKLPVVDEVAQVPTLSRAQSSLLGATHWLNTQPLSAEDIQGKVVLVNFWTYSCINCLRALPYIRAWAAKYKALGLVVVGVHTPEFAFEKSLANVERATGALGVRYPVAMDNDFAIWRAFGNNSWPALYFVGADGTVRHTVVGEREYDKSERLIQKLLSEANGAEPRGVLSAVTGEGAQAPFDKVNLRSSETYIGYGLGHTLFSPGGVIEDIPTFYWTAAGLPLDRWGLTGLWTIGREFATLNARPGSISYRFHARDVHLVMAPLSMGQSIRFRVTIDGASPGADHGIDVDADGWGQVEDARLYQLVRQSGSIKDRTFQIEFFDAGVRAYVFTFG